MGGLQIRKARRGAMALFFAAFMALPVSAWAEETAALPGTALLSPDGSPQVLSAEDAALYGEIFALQKAGRWAEADARIARLKDARLLGYLLFQRYMHPTAYRSSYAELRDWLRDYAELPEAERIHALALRRQPSGAAAPRAPEGSADSIRGAAYDYYSYVSPRRRSAAEARQVAEIKRQIRRNVLSTYLSKTEEQLASPAWTRLLDPVEIDEGYARVAAAWLYYGEAEQAFALAARAAQRSGQDYPLAHWTAGLAAWSLQRYSEAAAHFEAAARSRLLSGWNVSSSAYWAARAHLRLRQPEQMSRWLNVAAQYPRSFYGLLARRALGIPTGFSFTRHELAEEHVDALEATARGGRALALLQLGREELAEQELLGLAGWQEPRTTDALLALTSQAGLPALSLKLANHLSQGGRFGADTLDAAFYPLPPWQPSGGYAVDRALIYAFVRQESAFDPRATSGAGARGLMQLMPATASYVAGDASLRQAGGRDRLYDPSFNLALGQRYLAELLTYPSVGGDLFRLAAAYNGGPGNLEKWDAHVGAGDDPLLFIEKLPSRETRLFIERVLANLWIYRARLGQDSPSLTDLAAGD
ncbi:MAG: lytic transglycosylase domain-containing protein [Rhodovibrionaceae bacterium]